MMNRMVWESKPYSLETTNKKQLVNSKFKNKQITKKKKNTQKTIHMYADTDNGIFLDCFLPRY